MSIENLVIFKGGIDKITVWLDDKAPFDAVLKNFKVKLKDSKKFFNGARINLEFKGRDLNKDEQENLIKILTEQDIVEITFIHSFDENEIKEKEQQIQWIMDELAKQNTSFTYFHYGIVRSGQEITYNGSIVILGDVNPGAVVKADDNIIVLGNLKGKAHAGCNPKLKTSFVLAFGMYPVQIGIKNIIAQSPEEEMLIGKKDYIPQIAYIYKEQIYVEEIDFKTLNHMIE
ncbi:MAG: septum site-determining protein MinC [Cellulosilyticaceae bacterium]